MVVLWGWVFFYERGTPVPLGTHPPLLPNGFGGYGLGDWVWGYGLGFRVYSLGFGVWGLGVRGWGLGVRG